jgi:hypothetical protein
VENIRTDRMKVGIATIAKAAREGSLVNAVGVSKSFGIKASTLIFQFIVLHS